MVTHMSNKAVARRYYEQFLAEPSVADAIFASDYVHVPGLSRGPDGVREEAEMARKKFGDERIVSLHNLVAEGDLVVAEVTLTGQADELRQINWYRLKDGQIVERWWVEGPSVFEPVQSVQSETDGGVLTANKAVVRRYYDEVIGNPAVADELFTAEYIHWPGLTPGPEGVKHFMTLVKSKFGDEPRAVLDQLVAEGDLVAADFTLSGADAYTREMCMLRVAEGKIAARSCVFCDPPPGSRLCA